MKVSDYPHLKQEGRKKIFESYKDIALPGEKKILSMDELMEELKER